MLRPAIAFIKTLTQFRYTLWVLARQEIRSRYAGSLLGGAWNLINPMVMVFIYWMIFSVGFKVAPAKDIPFLTWFFCAFVVWSTFSDGLSGSANSLIKNRNLITKTKFPSQILPLVPILSSLINSLILMGLLVGLMLLQGVPLSWYSFQALYYLIGAGLLALGAGWFFSAASVLIKDLSPILTVVLQLLFWATPIFYQVDLFPAEYRKYFLLNPIYYLTEGFRGSFLYERYFWESGQQGLFFWGVVFFLLLFGGWFFKGVKNELADVI